MKCAYCDKPASGVLITGTTWTDHDQPEKATYRPACDEHGRMSALELAELEEKQRQASPE